MEFRLGQVRKDLISGVQGTLIMKSEKLHGSTQWAIQPFSEDPTKAHDPLYFDEHGLDFVDEGISARLPITDPTVTVKLGDRVRNKINGFSGIAISCTTHTNGCVDFAIQSEKLGKEGQSLLERFPHAQLEVVREGRHASTPETQSRGGPMVRIKREIAR